MIFWQKRLIFWIPFQVELSELVLANTLVLTVSATDQDAGLNGRVTYRLLSSPLQGFYIQPENGKNGLCGVL